MSPFLRTLIFTIIVPGFWTVLVPYWVVGRGARLELRGAAGGGGRLVAAGSAGFLRGAGLGVAVPGYGTPVPCSPSTKLDAGAADTALRDTPHFGVRSLI